MKNEITEIFENISDEELKDLINQIKTSEKDGIITDGVRNISKTVSQITGNPVSTELFLTQMNLFKEAAYRWSL